MYLIMFILFPVPRLLAQLIDLFNQTCGKLAGESFRHQVDASNMLFTRAMQIVMRDAYLRKTAKNSQNFMDAVKLAVEVISFIIWCKVQPMLLQM